ncbi:MAG: hypothetical protein CSA66_04180 [Proteobacteria bacterium]|nr:MAG: hypothetical protein CSA66_04180 [Pseudomonadota bacterium]
MKDPGAAAVDGIARARSADDTQVVDLAIGGDGACVISLSDHVWRPSGDRASASGLRVYEGLRYRGTSARPETTT